MGEKGGDSRHGVRCATRATGGTCAFLWQLLLLPSPHGWSPVTRTRQDVKPKQQPGELRCAEREQGGTGGSPSLRAHRQPLDCQAADSTAAILRRKKKSPCRFNGLRGFLRKRTHKANIRRIYTSFPKSLERREHGRPCARLGESSQLYSCSLCAVFSWRVRDNQHHSTNMARQQRLRSS